MSKWKTISPQSIFMTLLPTYCFMICSTSRTSNWPTTWKMWAAKTRHTVYKLNGQVTKHTMISMNHSGISRCFGGTYKVLCNMSQCCPLFRHDQLP
ncbi:hypothetical protein XELAEV_18011086mg [Xenopus laevis]|uniref:Uncharacterized protein n=1 Tax=Xenopus laevis TaxID=8355 RepID=A0A974I2J6_XENLA|nr:hypothetical protein XELAEV_18011086mg [Xenopus laevis]